METYLAQSIISILDRYAEPIIKKVTAITKAEWEKFKVDFDIAFTEYTKNAYQKYSRIKTILYRTEPKFIYDFFEIPFLEKDKGTIIKANHAREITDVSHFVLIQGTGGIGKSTLLKHMFIDELATRDLIPMLIELKNTNDINTDFDIGDLIFEKLTNLGSKVSKNCLEYALKSGCFLFLLDGYDEILTEKKVGFFKKLEDFCDKYSDNYFVISSRPYSEFIEFQRFTVLSTCPLSKTQAISMITKQQFDAEIKTKFLQRLDSDLYEKHRSFASNPLLLNIMLITFDNYADIPEKLHLFYSNAFETLYLKHDATKAGYCRELRSGLAYDTFKRVFSYFCYITYNQGKIELTRDEVISTLKKINISGVSINPENYLYDLINSLCVIYKDGFNYKFTHRSFQEYFTAVFFKDLAEDLLRDSGLKLIKKDIHRAINDDVYELLYDMVEDKFERCILIPLLTEFENGIENSDRYDYYFQETIREARFDMDLHEKYYTLWLYLGEQNRVSDFIYHFARYYVKGKHIKEQDRIASQKLRDYLEANKKLKSQGLQMSLSIILEDKEIYNIVKETWVGHYIKTMSNLLEFLICKKEEYEASIANLGLD